MSARPHGSNRGTKSPRLGIIAAVLAPLLLGAASVVPTTVVGTNQQLAQVLSYQYQAVLRLGVNQIGDAPGQWFFSLKDASGASLPCPIAGGDIGTQVPTSDGGCLVAIPLAGPRDVREWGVDMTGATASSGAMAAAAASGQSLYIPAGKVQFSSLTISGTQTITCAGAAATTLQQNTTAGDFITFAATAQYAGISNCGFQPIVRVTGNQVNFQYGCYSCYITNFWMTYVYNGIFDQASGVTVGGDNGAWSKMGSIYGNYGITYEGVNSTNKASNLNLSRVLINNAYPINPTGANVVTWAPGANYVQGNVTRVNGAIYQESAASCTSAASGGGPSGFPAGTSPFNIFSGTIADGTCTWQFVSNSLLGFVNNSWGNSAVLRDFTTLNNYESVKLLDNNNPGALSSPQFPHFYNVTADHPYGTGIDIGAGFDVEIYSPYAGSSLTGGGVVFGGAFAGVGKVIGGRVADNWTSGVALNTGTEFTVDGVSVGSNSQAGAGLYSNIAVGAGVGQFSVTNNKTGKDPEAGSAPAQYGVNLAAGASDYYVVTGNICGPGGTSSGTCVNDGGTGTHKTVSGNW